MKNSTIRHRDAGKVAFAGRLIGAGQVTEYRYTPFSALACVERRSVKRRMEKI